MPSVLLAPRAFPSRPFLATSSPAASSKARGPRKPEAPSHSRLYASRLSLLFLSFFLLFFFSPSFFPFFFSLTKRPINVCGRSFPVHSSPGPDSAPIFVLSFSRVSASLTLYALSNFHPVPLFGCLDRVRCVLIARGVPYVLSIGRFILNLPHDVESHDSILTHWDCRLGVSSFYFRH